MAVNYVDGTMFVSVIFYPIAATKAATLAGAGWFAILFVPAGLAVGVGITYVGRKLIYGVMRLHRESRLLERFAWLQWILAPPCFCLYFLLPIAIVCAGVWGTCMGSIGLVCWFRHAF